MKKLLFTLFVFLFLCPIANTYSQEEFFNKQSGLSALYLKGIEANASGFALSSYFKSGIAIGIGVERVYDIAYPVATLLLFPDLANKPGSLKGCFGIAYSYIEQRHIGGFTMGLIKCFLQESNFPFSINGSFLVQVPLKMSQGSGMSAIPIVGVGYTQAFFAKSQIYPFIGISDAFVFDTKSNIGTFCIGINMKFGANPSTNK